MDFRGVLAKQRNSQPQGRMDFAEILRRCSLHAAIQIIEENGISMTVVRQLQLLAAIRIEAGLEHDQALQDARDARLEMGIDMARRALKASCTLIAGRAVRRAGLLS